jgi:uncharacterized membrane protein
MDKGFFKDERPIADDLLTIAPALLAFTLAGMAIVMALSGQKFTRAIREGGREDSIFMKVSALFFHFILIQSIAMILAFFLKSYPSQDWLSALAFFFTTYGIASAIAIGAMLFNVARIYNIADDDDGSPGPQ